MNGNNTNVAGNNSRKQTVSKGRQWLNKFFSGDSLLIIAVLLIVIGLLVFYLTRNRWISGSLFAGSLAISVLCAKKNPSPYEFAVGGSAAITLTLFILYCTVDAVYQKITNLIKGLLLQEWDWLALLVAVISLIFAAFTWSSQERTQKNTMRITPKIQLNLLKDIFRHTYRNIMVLYALEARLRDRYNTHYPSEEHLQKLKLNEDVLYPESFIAHPDMCSSIQNLKLNLRNRNIEIDVIVEHLKDPSMPERIKARDVKMLKDGIEYTLKRTSELIRKIDREVISSDIADYVNEKAARRRYDSQAYPGFASRVDKAFELMDKGEFKPYYTAENSQFIKALFPDNDPAKITEFLRLLNGNIFAMETGEGEIWLIPFNKNDAPIVKSMYGKTTD